ncbi:tRNA pseudouridine(38-40) synthase TruA [Bacillaceae bacterium W0354]
MSMERIKLIIQYDGTNFAGYQVQLDKRTVQLDIEKALEKMHGEHIRIYSSGRTDANVHALGQVIHFDSFLNLDEKSWLRALSTLLPDDMTIKHVEKTSPTFHARKDAKKKTYQYVVLNRKAVDLFRRLYEWHVPQDVSIQKMEEAAKLLLGTHDFTPFSASKSNVKGDKTRTIYDIKIYKKNDRIYFDVTGNGFLTHMVRIIVGTLIEIGIGKKEASCINDAFSTLDRNKLGITAPGKGLYLKEVIY